MKKNKYYIINKEKIDEYKNKLSKAFVNFPCTLSEFNISEENGVYHYWRLKENSQDEMIVTKINLQDLVEVKI